MNKYIVFACILIVLVFTAYFIHFYWLLGYKLSEDSAVWAQLGDYAGGILNPILSFITIVLLIKSLTLQNDANKHLSQELSNSERTEKLRSFEALFFNMVNSQKELLDSFKISITYNDQVNSFEGVKAIIAVEEQIVSLRKLGADNQAVYQFIEDLDENDQIFGFSRTFYIMVKLITDKLSDSEGFTIKDRKDHYLTLINFTDFALIRMIMMCVQFTNYHSVEYLRDSKEFTQVIEDVGLKYDSY